MSNTPVQFGFQGPPGVSTIGGADLPATPGTIGQVLARVAGLGPAHLPATQWVALSGAGAVFVDVLGAGGTTALGDVDQIVCLDTHLASQDLELPENPVRGRKIQVIDTKGSCVTNPVAVLPVAAFISGAASDVISAAFASRTYVFTGSNWSITEAYL